MTVTLPPAVRDGCACVLCGADLTVPGARSVPWHIVDGDQLFVCVADVIRPLPPGPLSGEQ